ncbi:unnamed protein product [Effrenium voratum]|nr:unnamed protein product [Effrenium voratum]
MPEMRQHLHGRLHVLQALRSQARGVAVAPGRSRLAQKPRGLVGAGAGPDPGRAEGGGISAAGGEPGCAGDRSNRRGAQSQAPRFGFGGMPLGVAAVPGETLALREQELSDCREELQRLREHCASLEDREQKLAAVVGAGPTQVRAQPVYAPMAAATGSVRFDKMDANHDGIISKEEFESHCGNCGNLYMADTVFCRICGRRRQLAAAPSSAPSAASAGSPVRGSCMVHGLQAPAMAAPVSYVPMQQNVLFNRIDANHDGVLSTEELVSHCPGCGNVYMADSIFCRNCGRRRD